MAPAATTTTASAALIAVVAVPTLALMLVMLPAQTAALTLAGAWGFHSPAQFAAYPGFGSITFDSSNLTAIALNKERHGVSALYPIQWTQTRPNKCYAPIHRMRVNFTCVEIASNWEQLWEQQFAMLKPYIASGAVVGVFLGDEHWYFGVKVSDTALIADRIRADWPQAIIYQNEAPDTVMCGFNKLNETILQQDDCLPTNLDLFSFDFYDQSWYNSTWASAQEALLGMVWPRFTRASQRSIHVTTGWTDDPHANLTAIDDYCARNARQWIQFGLEQPLLAGVFPFYFPSSGSSTGLSGLPKCLATYTALGRIIEASGSLGTNTTASAVAPPPAALGAQGATMASVRSDKQWCPGVRPSPKEWWWCDRS